MCCLACEGLIYLTYYVTKFQLSDYVRNVPSTHPNLVLNSLSSSFVDASFLVWFVIVRYAIYKEDG